jgi:cytochrome c
MGAVLGAAAVFIGAEAARAGEYGERPPIALGQPIAEADLALWSIDVHTPSGANLPAGQGTVAEGAEVFANKCAYCHGDDATGGPMFGSMVGGIGSMTERPRVLTPGSMYPYAPALFDYVRRAMPLDAPQSLTADETYAVSAWLLNRNGLVPDDAVMDADTLAAIEMPNRDAFVVDDRPDVQAERCMADCEPSGTVADAEADG